MTLLKKSAFLNKKSLSAFPTFQIFCDKALDHQAKEVLGFSLKTNIDEIDASEVHAKFIATVIAVHIRPKMIFSVSKTLTQTEPCYKEM